MNGTDSLLGDHKDLPSWSLLWLVIPFVLLQFVPCDASSSPPIDGKILRTLLVDGRQVPVFATPEEQLRYARSTTFDETEEKAAALKALERVHPEAPEHAAMAALELAFLSLGDDYRLADQNQYLLARTNYLGVLEKYPDLPAIAAKALWYLGWITCDLEGDRQQGIRWFQRLITLYPHEKLSFAAPVPWLTIRQSEPDQLHAAYPKSVLTWTHLAHLEIIRHASDRNQAWLSFEAIRQADADESFATTALKVLVERHGFDEKSERLIREYLQQPNVSGALKNDLLLALSVHRRQAGGTGEPQ